MPKTPHRARSGRACPTCGRRPNPGRAAEKRAARDYTDFHWGNPPEGTIEADAPAIEPGEVVWTLGELAEVAYETTKRNEHAIWVHAFQAPRPVLAFSESGHLLIVGGGYEVTPRGIVK